MDDIEQKAALDRIYSELRQLREQAEAIGQPLLTYLLDQAIAETQAQASGRDGPPRRGGAGGFSTTQASSSG